MSKSKEHGVVPGANVSAELPIKGEKRKKSSTTQASRNKFGVVEAGFSNAQGPNTFGTG